MRRHTANLYLIENSTAGNPDRAFTAQTVFIQKEADLVVTGIDGARATASFDTLVRWQGGKATDLEGVTDVRIIEDGRPLVDGMLNLNFTVPTDIGGGMVEFAVFEGK